MAFPRPKRVDEMSPLEEDEKSYKTPLRSYVFHCFVKFEVFSIIDNILCNLFLQFQFIFGDNNKKVSLANIYV